jgi:hypothetical protein
MCKRLDAVSSWAFEQVWKKAATFSEELLAAASFITCRQEWQLRVLRLSAEVKTSMIHFN